MRPWRLERVPTDAFDDKKSGDIDDRNRPELLRIFDRYGWGTNSLAGKDAAHDFWLLVQHQPLDFQQRMLPALKAAADKNDASMADYAYLYDREWKRNVCRR